MFEGGEDPRVLVRRKAVPKKFVDGDRDGAIQDVYLGLAALCFCCASNLPTASEAREPESRTLLHGKTPSIS